MSGTLCDQQCAGDPTLLHEPNAENLYSKLVKSAYFAKNTGHMAAFTDTTSVLERHLLLQLGDRIKRLRKAQGLGTVEMAKRIGISRTTLAAVEAGDPAPSMGTYLRVMSVLGVAGDLALLVSDTFQPAPANSAAASSKRAVPQVQVWVRTDPSRHEAQDLQSMALHKEAIRLIQDDHSLLDRAQEVLSGKRFLRTGRGAKRLVGLGVLKSFPSPLPCPRFYQMPFGRMC